MATVSKKRYRYFLFSQNQYKLRCEAEARIGKQYVPGKVLQNGRWKDYTEISSTPLNNKFADAKIIAEGNLEDMEYKKASSEWRVR